MPLNARPRSYAWMNPPSLALASEANAAGSFARSSRGMRIKSAIIFMPRGQDLRRRADFGPTPLLKVHVHRRSPLTRTVNGCRCLLRRGGDSLGVAENQVIRLSRDPCRSPRPMALITLRFIDKAPLKEGSEYVLAADLLATANVFGRIAQARRFPNVAIV